MTDSLLGAWDLVAWRRIAADGTVSYPLGKEARGLLIYMPDGRMALQITGAGRPDLATGDPLGGDAAARADAYSSYLAYFGTYALQGDGVVHDIDGSLFPDWAGQRQLRQFTLEHGKLVLRTPPMPLADGSAVASELAWIRGR